MNITTDGEFLRLALNKYDNPKMTAVEEFQSDIRRFNSLKLLLNRFVIDKTKVDERLIINHIVVLNNCFTPHYSIPMMRYKVRQSSYSTLDTFLFYMGLVDCSEYGIDFLLLEDLELKYGRR